MQLTYNFILFLITLIGGSLPLLIKGMDNNKMNYLLSFSGSFLLSITFLHLLPETFYEMGNKAGLLLLAGFFIQLLIQRATHGIEHGHIHVHSDGHHHSIPLFSILTGLTVHAFMEGVPLGFSYRTDAVIPSLYLAVAAHKLPEAMLVATLVSETKGRAAAIITLILFALITPVAGIIATMLGDNYHVMSNAIMFLVPVVAGAFIHISTTIFFESGTKQHMLTWQKIIAIVTGVGIGFLTLLFE